jgi:hypothetical protein
MKSSTLNLSNLWQKDTGGEEGAGANKAQYDDPENAAKAPGQSKQSCIKPIKMPLIQAEADGLSLTGLCFCVTNTCKYYGLCAVCVLCLWWSRFMYVVQYQNIRYGVSLTWDFSLYRSVGEVDTARSKVPQLILLLLLLLLG